MKITPPQITQGPHTFHSFSTNENGDHRFYIQTPVAALNLDFPPIMENAEAMTQAYAALPDVLAAAARMLTNTVRCQERDQLQAALIKAGYTITE